MQSLEFLIIPISNVCVNKVRPNSPNTNKNDHDITVNISVFGSNEALAFWCVG